MKIKTCKKLILNVYFLEILFPEACLERKMFLSNYYPSILEIKEILKTKTNPDNARKVHFI